MSYYNLEQTLTILKENLPKALLPFELPQLADLCRRGEIVPLFYYGRYAIEIKEYPDKPKAADEKVYGFYSGYLTHERLINLLHKNEDELFFNSAIAYEEQKTDAWNGACYEIALKANDVNLNRFLTDANYSLYKDDDSFLVTRESLLFPSEQVQSYIASRQTNEQNTPEQQRIADLENQLAQAKAQLADKPANDTLLTAIHDKSNEYHAPDLSHAVQLWVNLYIDGLISTDSHSNKANRWINSNTSYGNNAEDSSVKRLREVSTPLKDFGGQRKR